MRTFPQIRFRWDYSPDRGARIDELLDRLQEERAAQQDLNGSEQEDQPTGSPQDDGREVNPDDHRD